MNRPIATIQDVFKADGSMKRIITVNYISEYFYEGVKGRDINDAKRFVADLKSKGYRIKRLDDIIR